MLKFSQTIPNETKTGQIYRHIKSSILKGEIPVGEKLVIQHLADQFNVSAIPVREALSRLEAENLVSIVTYTGIYVKGIDLECLRELYPLRGVLEGYAVRLAADLITLDDFVELEQLIERMEQAIIDKNHTSMGQLNVDFHRKIYTLSGNKTLISLIDNLWEKTFFARLVFKFKPYRAKDSNKEHRMIVDALKAGNAKRAEKLIIRQSDKTLTLLNRHMEKRKEGGTEKFVKGSEPL
jgi:DNA-binding GntR family transcriptional regulator